MKKNEKKLIFVGGGVVEACSEGYRARTQIVEYLTGFLRHYTNVTWATIAARSQDYTTKIDGIDVVVINRSLSTSIYSLHGIGDLLRHYRSFAKKLCRNTDVVVANLSLTNIFYVLLAKVFGGKLLLYMGSDPVLSFRLKKSYLSKIAPALNLMLLPFVIFLADVVFVRGGDAFRFCRPWNRHVFMSNPIISYGAFQEPNEKEVIRDRTKMLYVGKIDENKGVKVLIDAFEQGLQVWRGQDVSLDVVGSGPHLDALREKVLSCELEPEVVFHGFVDDASTLAGFFRQADLLIVPTMTHEGFPRVIDEAFACGVPVACTRIGGMKYLEGQQGVCFVGTGDVDGLKAVLERYVGDKSWRDQMKVAAHKRARNYLKEPASEQHAMAMLR